MPRISVAAVVIALTGAALLAIAHNDREAVRGSFRRDLRSYLGIGSRAALDKALAAVAYPVPA
jgi:hypothetical protein